MRVTAEIEVRPVFLPLFAADFPRFSVIVAHRRAGKTVASVQRLVKSALETKLPSARFGFIAPLRLQAKAIAWDMLKNMLAGMPGAQVNESELRLDLPNQSRIRLFGADQPDAIRGGYFDGVVLDEYAQMDPRTWDEVVRPMLADRQGWAQFIGSPAGKNAFWRLYEAADGPDWARLVLRASETGLIPMGELEAARRTMSREAYEQEWECSFTSATRGVFYGELMEQAEHAGRITAVPYDPALPCVTSWDLGVRDATAIWVLQPAPGGALHAVDFIESAGVGLPWYAEQLRARPYRYTDHVAPPDIEVTELGSGRSRREIAAGLGINFTVAKPHRILDGIEGVRVLLPRIWFDRERCARGIDALAQYRQEWDPKLQNFKAIPLHDWTSHAADALRYYAMANVGNATSPLDDWSVRINVKQERRNPGAYRRSA